MRTYLRLPACLVACIALLACLLIMTAESPAAAAQVTTNASTSVSNNSSQTINIPITPGLTPRSISGRIASPQSTGGSQIQAGTVTITAGGQRVYSGPAQAATFNQQLNRPALVNGILNVVVAYSVPSFRNDFCSDNSQQVAVNNIRLDLTGEQISPTTVSKFLSPGVNGVNVLLPENPSQDLIGAGLAAVGAATYVLESSAQVRMSIGALDPRITAIPGSRVISLKEGDNPVQTSIDQNGALPQLNLVGSSTELTRATTALGGTELPLASSADTKGLSKEIQPTLELTKSFAALDATNPKLSGWGTQSIYVGVDQTEFGGAIANASVRIVGTHSAIPNNTTSTLNLFWNDNLIASQVLGTETGVDLTADIPDSQLQAQNGLRVVLSTVPSGGLCTGNLRVIPIDLSLDDNQSQITATKGQTLDSGFARFPQALGGTLPVALDEATPINTSAVQAALLVASLQRASQQQLVISVVSLADISGTSTAGLVVGANEATSDALQAPLRLTEFRTIATANNDFSVGVGDPFAALEAFSSGNRNLIMLGNWAPNEQAAGQATTSSNILAEAAYSRQGGWNSLNDNLFISQPDSEPFFLNSNSVIPQESVTSEYSSVFWWVLAIVALFVGLGLWRYLSIRRTRRKIERYVDAQEEANSAETNASESRESDEL